MKLSKYQLSIIAIEIMTGIAIIGIIALGVYLVRTGRGVDFSNHYPFVTTYELPKDSSLTAFGNKNQRKVIYETEMKRRMFTEIGDANSASYNPNTQTFEVWFSGLRDTALFAKTVVPSDSTYFRATGDSIFDMSLILLKDGERWIFAGFTKKIEYEKRKH